MPTRTPETEFPHLIDGRYGILDLVDIDRLRRLFEQFSLATGFAVGMLDHPGMKVLISTGWKEICSRFHGAHPDTLANCIKSNHRLLDGLDLTDTTVIEQCDNGLIDCAVPIVIQGKHVASLVTGQTLLRDPDIERFKTQGRAHGFDEALYLRALNDVTVVDEQKLKHVVGFLGDLASMISELGYTRLKAEQEAAERRRIEDDLRTSEQRLLTILDNVDAFIYLKDSDGKYLFANRPVRDLWRTDLPDIVGFGDEKFFDARAVADIRRNDARVLKDGETLRVEEANSVPATGRAAIYQSTKLPLRDADGRIYGLCGISTDVTARKEAEMALAERESQLRSLIESVPDSIQFKDGDGRWLIANSVCLHLFGLEGQAWQGLTDTELGVRHPHLAAGLALCKASDDAAWESGESIYRTEERVVDGPGNVYDFDVVKVPLFNDARRRRALAIIGRDISQRKKIKDQLRMQSLVLDQIQDHVTITDLEGIVVYVNQTEERALKASRDTLVGRHVSAYGESPEADATQQEIVDATLRQGAWQGKVVNYRVDGSYIVLNLRTTLVRNEDGAPVAMVGIGTDITERQKIDEALRLSEAHSRKLASMLRMMCDNVPDMIWAKDLDQHYLFANKAMCTTLLQASDTDEPVGRTDLFFAQRERQAHPQDPQWHTFGELCQDTDTITLGHGKPSVFEESGNVRGKFLCLDVHKSPFFDASGEIIGTVGSARDITERKQIEAELERHRKNLEELVQQRTAELLETEARASHILQSSADGLYGVDRKGTITFINPAACTMLGFSVDQAIGYTAHALFHHSKPDGSPFPIEECPGHQALLTGTQIRVDDQVYWHADGHAVPVMYAIHPMFQDGKIAGAVISFVDMSAQRAAAQAREQALVAAENLARARREFLANMSHEIRTPLNGVMGFAEIGYRNYLDSAKARNAFEKILLSGNRLLAVVNEILDFSKIEVGKLHIDAIEVLLGEILDHAVDLVGDRARAKGLVLKLEKAPDLPLTCIGDPMRLGQVLLNLLSNAVKFTERGCVTLSAACAGGQLVFRVTDTGIGIDAAQLPLLFKPFQQADGSTTRRFGGTGLGLAISKRIVELMNGAMRVESSPGMGSMFEFRLPYVASRVYAADQVLVPENARTQEALAGLTILVAEDDAVNQMVLADNLSEDGAVVVMVGDGREAVERVAQEGGQAFDIVLMDVQMPVMDGYEAARHIHNLAPDLPIIGQTAHAFSEEREKCFAAGMIAHIAKPIDADALVKLILEHLGARHLPGAR